MATNCANNDDRVGGDKPRQIISPILLNNDNAAEDSLDKSISLDISDNSAKVRGGSLKRVSFGTNAMTTNIQTFVYENVQVSEDGDDGRPRFHYSSPPPPLSPPTKIVVGVCESQLPYSIEPPSEIGLLLADGTVASASSVVGVTPNVAGVAVLATTATAPLVASRRMEDHENPFRPEGSLSTEVGTIVEGFKMKPFHAPSSADDLPSETTTRLMLRATPTHTRTRVTDDVTRASRDVTDGGGCAAVVTLKTTSSNGAGVPTDIEHKLLPTSTAALAAAGYAELVRLDNGDMKKRRRCKACCSVQ